VIVGDGLLIGVPLGIKTPFGDLAISGLGPWPASPCLAERMFFADGAIDLEVATDGVLIENHFYLLIDLGGALQPCFCASQPLAYLLELFCGRGDVSAPPGLLA
jgi:hypothetical protein